VGVLPGVGGPGVGVGQVARVHDEVLVAGPRPLNEDSLALETHQEVTAPVGGNVLTAEGLHEAVEVGNLR